MHKSTKDENLLITLAALSLFLASLEFLFPKPIPFMRLGLANIPLLLSLPLFNWKQFSVLILIKVLGQGIINGTLLSYPFFLSLTGTYSSGIVMYTLYKYWSQKISMVGISLMGSFCSMISQSTLAVFFILGIHAWPIVLTLLWIAIASGLIIGVFTLRFMQSSTWYQAKLRDCRNNDAL